MISTSNRNFENRQGKRTRTHLASPLTVAASAVAGHIADVREARLMEALREHAGIAAPLLRANVDTDQIIPTRFLTRMSEEGLGEGLFAEWARAPRRHAGPGLPPQPAAVDRGEHPRGRTDVRLRLVARGRRPAPCASAAFGRSWRRASATPSSTTAFASGIAAGAPGRRQTVESLGRLLLQRSGRSRGSAAWP